MRIALGVQYNGLAYHGWQRQPQMSTVQGCVESALSSVAACPVSVTCAGRTDTGVHATYQVVHFDTDSRRELRAWVFGTNSRLPVDISVLWAQAVNDTFSARYSAEARQYRYFIYDKRTRPAIMSAHVTWNSMPLDAQLMHEAAQYLIGEHDFSAYRAVGCQSSSPCRHMKKIDVSRTGDMVIIDVEADSFLHHMVRNIVGVLMAVGHGTKPPVWARQVLQACDRRLAGVTAPAAGLYLVGIEYPAQYELPLSVMPQIII